MDTSLIAKINAGKLGGEEIIALPEFNELVALLQTKTNRWARMMGYNDARVALPERLDKLKKILGSRRVNKDMQNLVLDILQLYVPGEDFEAIRGASISLSFTTGIVAVPIVASPNHHDYTLNRPAICFRGTRFLNGNGNMGNEMTDAADYIRPATPDEIRTVCENIARNNAQTFALLLSTLF